MANALPSELWLELLENSVVSTDDLFNLARVSRKLNILALPVFLARNGISDPETYINLTRVVWDPRRSAEPADALAGLEIATYLTGKSVKRLICNFQVPDSPYNLRQHPEDLHRSIHRLARFIERLESVDTITLYLISDRQFCKHSGAVTSASARLVDWTIDFDYLLNSIITRGVISLTVQYDSNVDTSEWYKFHPRSRNTNFLSRLFGVFHKSSSPTKAFTTPYGSWHESTFLPYSDFPQLCPPTGHHNNRIQELAIHSTTLLTPPFLPWTLAVLRSSQNLTSLSFAHLTFTSDIWTALLSSVSDAIGLALTELSILKSCRNLGISELLKFICRLPNLTKLRIYHTFHIRIGYNDEHTHFDKMNYPIPALTQLQTLEAHEEIISHLLRARLSRFSRFSEEYCPLPSLQSLTIYPSSLLADTTSYAMAINSWNDLLRQLMQPTRKHQISFGLDIQADSRLEHTGIAAYLEPRATSVNALGEDLLPVFQKITNIILFHFDVSYHGDPATLCQWLHALFPDLRCLTFTCTVATVPDQVFIMSGDSIAALTGELTEKCSHIEKLVVADRTFTLDAGTRIEEIVPC